MVPGPILPPIEARPVLAVVQNAVQTQRLPGGLTVTFRESALDAETSELVLAGDVTATYGETVLSCPSLRLNTEKMTGVAEGGVTLLDPEGRLTCQTLSFDWGQQTGAGTDIVLQADNVHITAQSLQVFPGRWELSDARGSLSRVGTAPVSFLARSVTIDPGHGGVARGVYLLAYGAKIGPVPRMSFSLNRRVKGIGIPSITNKKGAGLGVSWDASIAVGDHGAASGFWGAFPRNEPGFGLQYAYSAVSPDSPTLITPEGDLGERFGDAWFENIGVKSLDDEESDLRFKRKTFAIGSFWNQSTTGRPVDQDNVSKRYEAVFDAGGEFSGFGSRTTVRLQSIRSSSTDPFKERAVVQSTALSPQYRVLPGLAALARADGFGTLSDAGTYGWGRVEAGLVYRPIQQLTMGASYSVGGSAGTPDFPFDGLWTNHSLNLRADYVVGPYTFRYLAKYDDDKDVWYDREYEVSLAAREFEPYIVFRQFPSDTRFGIRFRIDRLRDRLMRRHQNR